jgi:hypothetical protein
MKPTHTTPKTPGQPPAPPAPRRLALTRETLRRLTPANLRLAAGGRRTSSDDPTACRGGYRSSTDPTAC